MARFEGTIAWMYCDAPAGWLRRVSAALSTLCLWLSLFRGCGEGRMPPPPVSRLRRNGLPSRPERFLRREGLVLFNLSAASVASLTTQRLLKNEAYLARRWASWNDWPADAQLGAHSIAWAAGPAWVAPHFDAAVTVIPAGFAVCAGPPGDANLDVTKRGEAWLRDGSGLVGPGGCSADINPGLRPRNLANKVLFLNASRVSETQKTSLFWPATASA